MIYGMLVSESCLLTNIVDTLHENAKKVNSVERITRHLNKRTSANALRSYLSLIRKWVSSEPVIHIDDSDIIKPDSYKFEALGLVRDGSKSTNTKSVYEKGYHVTEACAISAITDWQKVSPAYFPMPKKVSDFGSERDVLHTINSTLS